MTPPPLQSPAGSALAALRARPVGIWTASLDSLPAPQVGEVVSELDSLGFGSLWFPEAYGRESLTTAQLLVSAARRLVIGTGIASIYARGPMATAAGARLLHALAPGRFVLGLGVSHRPLVERDRGVAYQPPVRAMADYLDGLQRAPYLAADGPLPPVVLAALGPRMLELARARTAGAHPYLVTPEHTAQARARLGEGPLLVVEQAVVLHADRAEGLRLAHEHLGVYTGLANYRRSWLRQGFEEADLVRGGSRRLAEALVAFGGAPEVGARVRAHLDAGADHVCVQALGAGPADVPQEQWRQLAAALSGVGRPVPRRPGEAAEPARRDPARR